MMQQEAVKMEEVLVLGVLKTPFTNLGAHRKTGLMEHKHCKFTKNYQQLDDRKGKEEGRKVGRQPDQISPGGVSGDRTI